MPGFAPVETSSMILVRGLLRSGRRLTRISRHQVATEVATGTMIDLGVLPRRSSAPDRHDNAQGLARHASASAFLDSLRAEARALGQLCGPGNP